MMSQLTVRELMKTPVVVVHPQSTLTQARNEMARVGIHHLPVVDAGGALLGMVSQRDVERTLGLMNAANGGRETITVGDITSGEGLRVGPELPAHEAAAMLIESRTDGLPVVDGGGHVIGVLTVTDLIEVAREALLGVAPSRRARA
jgi:CBS domain-containing protein